MAAFTPYATLAELSDWLSGDAPDNAVQLLRSATLLVQAATAGAVYATNGSTGMPVDSGVRSVLSSATCAQVAAWAALGVDPAAGAAGAAKGAPVQSSSIGGASVSYAVPSNAGDLRAASVGELADEAALILSAAGLLTAAVAAR